MLVKLQESCRVTLRADGYAYIAKFLLSVDKPQLERWLLSE